MTEPKKLAIVFLVLMVLGTLALAIEWFRMKVNGWLVLIIISLVLLMMALSIHHTRAQEHRHPPQHEALHHKFYKHWKMPTNRAVSCCNDQDCKPAESYMKDGRWYARHEGDTGPFNLIPQERVDMGLPDSPESPDFRAHLCGTRYGGNEFTTFCFIAGNGS